MAIRAPTIASILRLDPNPGSRSLDVGVGHCLNRSVLKYVGVDNSNVEATEQEQLKLARAPRPRVTVPQDEASPRLYPMRENFG